MAFILLGFLSASAVASPVETLSLAVQPKQVIAGTVEYTTECKSCPYSLCPNVLIPSTNEIVTLTCWTRYEIPSWMAGR